MLHDAERKAVSEEVARIVASMDQPLEVGTFYDACDKYLDRGEIGETDAIYLDRLRRELGPFRLDKISNKLIDVIVVRERMARGLANGSIRRELNTLQAILNYAVDEELVDVAVKVRKPKGDKKRETWLDADEAEAFIELCDPEFRTFAAFLFYTGCRLGEAIKADWKDMVGDVLTVRSRKGKDAKEKIRSVPIHPKLKPMLGSGKKHGRILTRSCGAKWSKGSVYDFWNIARKKMAIDDLTPHCARHSFASQLILAGVDGRTVAELLGHSSMDMMKRYTHLNTKHLTDAVLRLGV